MFAFRVPSVEEQWAARQLHDMSRDLFTRPRLADSSGASAMLRYEHHCIQCVVDARDARWMRDAGDEDPVAP